MTTPARGSRYVAIGSSFAAGPGLAPPASDRPKKARQSASNYPHRVAQLSGFDLADVTSSGATVDNVLRTPQFGQAPQIAAVTAGTALVTVTVGGNDLAYIPSLMAASLPDWVWKAPLLGARLRQTTAPSRADDRLTRTADSVGQIFPAIREQAPEARIVCVDYLSVLPPTYRDDLPFDEPEYRRLAALADDLNAAIARACSEHDVELVTASAQSIGHSAWSENPWTSGWSLPRPGAQVAFHPTAQGMSAVADLVVQRLGIGG